MPKNDASAAYGRVAQSIAYEYAALSPKEKARFLFILSNDLRQELVKHLQRQHVVKGSA